MHVLIYIVLNVKSEPIFKEVWYAALETPAYHISFK